MSSEVNNVYKVSLLIDKLHDKLEEAHRRKVEVDGMPEEVRQFAVDQLSSTARSLNKKFGLSLRQVRALMWEAMTCI